MSIVIEGKSGGPVESKLSRLDVSSQTAPRAFFASRDFGRAFSWTSSVTATDGEETAYLQNTSPTRLLVIDQIVCAGLLACVHAVGIQTSGTAAGTVMTGRNLNLSNTNTPEATAFGNALVTGSVDGNIIGYAYHGPTSQAVLDYNDSLILGQNDAMFIRTAVGVSGLVYLVIEGHYEAIE